MLHAFTVPSLKPFENQRLRCSELAVGEAVRHHRALRRLCSVSSPMADAVCNAASISPGSRNCFCASAWLAQTPAKQSACSSTRPERLDSCGCLTPAGPAPPGQNAEQILHVVADLMGDHIGLGKIAGLAGAAAEARLKLAEEVRVEIDLAIVRAKNGPIALWARPQAERAWPENITSLAAEGLTVIAENVLPLHLGAAEDARDEPTGLHRTACRCGARGPLWGARWVCS